MKAAKGDREKQQIAKAVSGDILKKYRAIKHIKPFCSWKRYNSSMIRQKFGVYERKRRNIIEYEAVKFEVQQFLELDCNSKLCPGKKDCVTQGSVKKQKRFLTDTMENLHRKFLEETERFHTLHSARCILSGYFSQGLSTDKHVFVSDMTICSFWWISSISLVLRRLQTSLSYATVCAAMPITKNVLMVNANNVKKRRYQYCLTLIPVLRHFTTNGQHRSKPVQVPMDLILKSR